MLFIVVLSVVCACNKFDFRHIEDLIAQKNYDEASRLIAKKADKNNKPDALTAAHLSYYQGKIYFAKFNYDSAAISFEQAEDASRLCKDSSLLLKITEAQANNFFRKSEYPKAKLATDTLILLAKATGSNIALARGLSILAGCMVTEGNDSMAIATAREAIAMGEKLKDFTTVGTAYVAIGITHGMSGNYKESIGNLQKAITALKVVNEEYLLVIASLNLGLGLQSFSNYKDALIAYEDGVKYATAIRSNKLLMKLYHNIGSVYLELNSIDDALASFKKSRGYESVVTDKNTLYHNYLSIAKIFQTKQQNDSALLYLAAARNVKTERRMGTWHEASIWMQLGELYLELDNLEEAEVAFRKAIEINNTHPVKKNAVILQLHLAKLYLKKGQTDKSVQIGKSVIPVIDSLNDFNLICSANELLYQTYKQKNNYAESLVYFEKYNVARDSLLKQNSELEIGKLKANLEYQQEKEATQNYIDALTDEISVKKQRNNLVLVLLGMFVLLCAVIIFAYVKLSNSRKKLLLYNQKIAESNAQMAAQNREMEKSNQIITLQNEQLQAANHNLLNFANIAAHDIKAPIRTIKSFSDIINLKYRPLMQEKDHQLLDFIIVACQDLTNMIQVLLAFSKTTENLPEPTIVNITDTARRVIDSLQLNIEEADASIHVAQDLPVVLAHPTLLQQLLQNLIGNSIKYRKEKETSHIEIGLSAIEKDTACFFVKDTGRGIPALVQPTVFNLFSKYHSTEKNEGYGIGLSTCKKIVLYYGGKIWVESEEGKGATFFFTLRLPPPVLQ